MGISDIEWVWAGFSRLRKRPMAEYYEHGNLINFLVP
jgi:hypothetical protein